MLNLDGMGVYGLIREYIEQDQVRLRAAEQISDAEEAQEAISEKLAPAFERGDVVLVGIDVFDTRLSGTRTHILEIFRAMNGALEIDIKEVRDAEDLAFPPEPEPDYATADAVMSACGASCNCFDDEVE